MSGWDGNDMLRHFARSARWGEGRREMGDGVDSSEDKDRFDSPIIEFGGIESFNLSTLGIE